MGEQVSAMECHGDGFDDSMVVFSGGQMSTN
jgi:hypothetical protein